MNKIFSTFLLLFSFSIFAGGGGGYVIPEEIVEEVYEEPYVEPVIQAPIIAEPQIVEKIVERVVEKDCNCTVDDPSRWVGDFYLYECNTFVYTKWFNTDVIDFSHVQFGMSYFQKYYFNQGKIDDYMAAAARGDDVHLYDAYAGSLGIYFGPDLYSRILDVDLTGTGGAGSLDRTAQARVDLHAGLSYQFRFWRKVLHNLDVGAYYSVALQNYFIDNTPTTLDPENNIGVYLGIPTYFLITDNVSFIVRVAARYDLGDKIVNLPDSHFLDVIFGIGARFQF